MTQNAAERAASRINEHRLWQRLMEMARCGATPRGGVNRQALSPEDGEARRLIVGWARERRCDVATDAIGNLYLRRPGTAPDSSPVTGCRSSKPIPRRGRI